MSSRARLTGRQRAVAAAGAVALSATFAAQPALAQPAPTAATTSIQQGSEKVRLMKEPSFQTREARLAAKPLDWNKTIGTPKPRVLTPEERRALEIAKPTTSAGGAPNPNAEREARRLHPDDWK
jgi:hypothetical protein